MWNVHFLQQTNLRFRVQAVMLRWRPSRFVETFCYSLVAVPMSPSPLKRICMYVCVSLPPPALRRKSCLRNAPFDDAPLEIYWFSHLKLGLQYRGMSKNKGKWETLALFVETTNSFRAEQSFVRLLMRGTWFATVAMESKCEFCFLSRAAAACRVAIFT